MYQRASTGGVEGAVRSDLANSTNSLSQSEDRFSSDRGDSTTRPRKCSRSVQIVNAAGRTPENRCRVRAKRDRVLKINPRTCIDFQYQLLAAASQRLSRRVHIQPDDRQRNRRRFFTTGRKSGSGAALDGFKTGSLETGQVRC